MFFLIIDIGNYIRGSEASITVYIFIENIFVRRDLFSQVNIIIAYPRLTYIPYSLSLHIHVLDVVFSLSKTFSYIEWLIVHTLGINVLKRLYKMSA